MIQGCDYDASGKFMMLRSSEEAEPIRVPVSFVDELLERELTALDLETLRGYRAVTRDAASIRKVAMKDLVGEDLTGKTVTVEVPDAPKARMVSSNQVVGVRMAGSVETGLYKFVFSDEDAAVNSLLNWYRFYQTESILITETLERN